MKFLNPVDSGSLLKYTGRVTYIKDKLVNILVTVDSVTKEQADSKSFRTNEFTVTFKMDSMQGKRAVPGSYWEAMLFLQGRRKVKNLLDMNY